MMIFYPMITRKITRKQLMTVLIGISAVGYCGTLVFGWVIAETTMRFWMVTIANMLANFGQYGFYLIMMISIINTGQLPGNELPGLKRMIQGTFASTYPDTAIPTVTMLLYFSAS